jgi:feruloyl esterase
LAAAQKYPEDFNGIIAGAASWDQMRIHGARVALNLLVNKDADSIIPASKYPMIHQAVLNACDGSDGVKDGVIENPLQCKFDYAQLACKAGDNAECLTKGQVESAKTMTSVLKDPKSGKVLFDKYLMPGSELGWATLGGPEPLPLSTSGMKNVVFQNPSWDYHTMNISADVDRAANSDNGAMYAGDPDLNPFFAHGGKLLMYHGWTDPQISPLLSITYYNKVVKTVGKNNATKSIALFMMPGMDHCRGGSGPAEFDAVNTLEQWVEQARTPQQIIASHKTDGKVDRTRPLCPYPQVAKYKGAGSTDEAANFVCKAQ